MKCPKCGHEQNENLSECAKCGVIFAKFIEREVKRESLEKQYQEISDEEIKELVRSKSETLHPVEIGIIEEEIRKRNLSHDLIAAIDQKKRPAGAAGRPKSRALKIVLFSLLALVLFAFFSYRFLDDALFGEHELEQFNLTYRQYVRKTNAGRIKIPKSSQNIHIFGVSGRDYWCNAIQAEVRNTVPDLHAIVSEYQLYNVSHPILTENVSSPMDKLGSVIGYGEKLPAWLQTEDPMLGFERNVLKYGQERAYGRGIWAFYNDDTQILRVFSWSIQHLSFAHSE